MSLSEISRGRKRPTKGPNELTIYTLPGYLWRVSPSSGTHSLNGLFPPFLLITLKSRFDTEKISSGKRLKKIFWEKNRGIIPHDSFVTAYQFFWWSMQGANTWITGHERDGWGAGDFPSIAFRRQSSTKFTWILFLPLIFDINYSWVIINLNFPLCTFVLVELSGAPHKHAF